MPIKDDWEFGDQFTHDDANDVAGAVNANESALGGKADASHVHSAGDTTSGTFDIARIPTGTSGSTVCVGNDARLSNTRTPTDNTVSTAKIQNSAVTIGKTDFVVDEDDMASNSATKVPTQQSVKAYVDSGRVQAYANGTLTARSFDVLNETQWAGVGSPVSGRIYLVFED